MAGPPLQRVNVLTIETIRKLRRVTSAGQHDGATNYRALRSWIASQLSG